MRSKNIAQRNQRINRRTKISAWGALVLALVLVFSQVFLGTAQGLDDQQSSSTQTTTAATQTSNQDAGQASSEASTAGQNSTAATAEETADGSAAANSMGEASASTASSDEISAAAALAVAEEMLEESAGVTRADVLALSEAEALTAQVITELLQGEIDPAAADTVGLNYFTFTTDEEEPPSSDYIKTQALVDSANQDSVPAGEVAGLFNETIGVDGKNYFLEGVTVGGMEISSVGNLEIAGETYVYYVTDETKTDATVYTVLNAESSATASNTITVSYARGDIYQISYEIQSSDGTISSQIGSYNIDTVFGAERTTSLEVPYVDGGSTSGGAYTVSAQIPRGYTATVTVYNLDADGNTDGSAVFTGRLGQMLTYIDTVSNGLVQLADGSPTSIELSKSFAISGVNSDQNVVITYEQQNAFTFSAVEWFQSSNANAGYGIRYRYNDNSTKGARTHSAAITVEDAKGNQTAAVSDSLGDSSDFSVAFTSESTITLEFTSQNVGSSIVNYIRVYRLNSLQINGEYVTIPYLAEQTSVPASATTTLSTGTQVTVTAEDLNPNRSFANASDTLGDRYKETKYTVEITNCYEDLTISGGNVSTHNHQEVGFETISGIEGLAALQLDGTWYGGISGSGFTTGERHALSNTTSYSASTVVYRFAHVPGYFLPQIAVKDWQGNDISDAIQYLRLRDGYSVDDSGVIKDSNGDDVLSGSVSADTIARVFETVSYADLTPNVGEYYFFKYTDDVISNMSTHIKLYLYLNGALADLEVRYDDGAETDATDSSPAAAGIENLPATDDNGGAYYDVESDYIVAVSSSIPLDTSGQFTFAGWQVVAVGDGWTSDVVTASGEPVVLQAGTYLNLREALTEWEQGAITYPAYHSAGSDPAYFTFIASWTPGSAEVINYTVTYAVDGHEVASEGYRANQGAKLVFQAFDTEGTSYTAALQAIVDDYVSSVNAAGGVGGSRISASDVFLDNVTVEQRGYVDSMLNVTTQTFPARQLLDGGVLIGEAEGLNRYTVITVNFGTGIPVYYEFASATDGYALPDEVEVLLEAALLEEGVPLYASFQDSEVTNGLWDYAFAEVATTIDGVSGTWSFSSWDLALANYDADTENVTFTGSWVFTVDETGSSDGSGGSGGDTSSGGGSGTGSNGSGSNADSTSNGSGSSGSNSGKSGASAQTDNLARTGVALSGLVLALVLVSSAGLYLVRRNRYVG